MKKNTCFFMLAALMMAGCSNEIEEQVMDSRRVPLQINGDINMLMTRAADDHWDANDAIGVYMVSADNSIVGDVSNYRYVVIDKDNGNFSPDGEANTAYFPESDDVVNVVAYYPQGNVVENKLSLDLANQDEQPRIDLMSAKAEGASKNNPTINLGFKHRLTKLFFEIEGDVNTDGIYAAIDNQYTDIQYDILNDKLLIAEGSEKKDIVMKYWNLDEGKNRFVEAIVLPNMEGNSAQERTLTFTLNGKDYKATINAQTVFEAGKKYIYTVTFTTEGSVKIQGAGIENWDIENDGPEIEVKPDIYITGAIGGGWGTYSKMDKKPDNIYVWTGIIRANEEFKFTFDETYDHGKEQIMSSDQKNETGAVTLVEGTESNIYKVLYELNGPDNKWKVAESGTYMVKLDMNNNKISIEKKIFILGLNGDYDQATAPSFARVGDGKYELTVTFSTECSFSMSLWSSNDWDMDCYMPMPVEENNNRASFTPGTTMTVIKENRKIKDVQWQVTADQTGTYKLTLDVSNPENVTLTAEKLANQQ